MNTEKIKSIEDRIKNNREKLKEETGNLKNQQILRLKIKIDEIQIQIEKLK